MIGIEGIGVQQQDLWYLAIEQSSTLTLVELDHPHHVVDVFPG